MKNLKAVAIAAIKSPRVRRDAFDIAKVVVGVIAARYGIKLA